MTVLRFLLQELQRPPPLALAEMLWLKKKKKKFKLVALGCLPLGKLQNVKFLHGEYSIKMNGLQ